MKLTELSERLGPDSPIRQLLAVLSLSEQAGISQPMTAKEFENFVSLVKENVRCKKAG